MGQKANLISLRKNIEKVLLINTVNSELFVKSLVFLNFFEKFCNIKNILISFKTISLVSNKIYFYFEVFFRTNKLMFYKKKQVTKVLSQKKTFYNRKITSFLASFFDKSKHNLVCLNLNVLNLNLVKDNYLKVLKQVYAFNKRFLFVLFDRRLNLFIDFLKIVVLFVFNKISINVFLFTLCQIFKNISKAKHTKFLLFVRELFFFLINFNLNGVKPILGLKLVINGKIKGKTRASSTCIKKGSVPIQSISKKIEYSKLHVFTRYGAFGFQIWVHFK
jgi:hypothetical protein